MRGVRFGNYHSYVTWKLMLKKAPEISSPEPKTHYVDVLGAHGSLDLTEALAGKVLYKNRTIKMEFVSMAGRTQWPVIYSNILSALHGKLLNIVLDEDISYTYKGRVTVGDPVWENNVVTLKMTAEVEPYKKTSGGVAKL